MLKRLAEAEKVVGVKQTMKAIRQKRARRVTVANDANPLVLQPVIEACLESGVELCRVPHMAELGEVCGIEVGCAAVTETI